MQFDLAKLEQKTINKLLNLKNKDILEVGCGDGRITQMLKKKSNYVLAIEPDKEALKLARKKFPGVNFKANTLSNLKTTKKFDLIVFSMSYHHVSLRSKVLVLKKAKELLKEKGRIFIIEPAIASTVCKIVFILDAFEKKRIQDAQSILKGFKAKKIETVELEWKFSSLFELRSFFEKKRRVSTRQVDKIKKIVQANDENKEIVIKDKISYFVIAS